MTTTTTMTTRGGSRLALVSRSRRAARRRTVVGTYLLMLLSQPTDLRSPSRAAGFVAVIADQMPAAPATGSTGRGGQRVPAETRPQRPPQAPTAGEARWSWPGGQRGDGAGPDRQTRLVAGVPVAVETSRRTLTDPRGLGGSTRLRDCEAALHLARPTTSTAGIALRLRWPDAVISLAAGRAAR